MSLTIDLPKEIEAALASQALAAHVPTERYLAEIIEEALRTRQLRAAKNLNATLDEMATAVQPETTRHDMEAALEEALAAVRPRRPWAQ